jgi:hypothetical protein
MVRAFRVFSVCSLVVLVCAFSHAGDYPTYPSFGTTAVPLNSWIYPAFDRLVALGYAPSAIEGIKPWTRLECARLLEESQSMQEQTKSSAEADRLLSDLRKEFAPEMQTLEGGSNRGYGVESVYGRSMSIAGRPLTDAYHFGETIVNDSGRPFSRGESGVLGGSGVAFYGPFSLYLSGEYQHAPAPPALNAPQLTLISKQDQIPFPPPVKGSVDEGVLLDSYGAINLGNLQLSFGKESTWWSPDQGSSFSISDNAEPMYMFRMARVTPFKLPWIFEHLGPMRTDFFFGKLSGNQFPPRPLLHGEKISFKPTPNLEFGVSRTAEFGGLGRALTPAAILNSYFSPKESSRFGPNDNPGKRGAGFDFSYRIPGLRNWLTLYDDAFANDDPSPLAAPRRAAMDPGLYFSRLPFVHHLDLRMEAPYTDVPAYRGTPGSFIYWDAHYHDYYNNKAQFIGSWVGRESKGYQAWSTYWFSAVNTIQAGFRHQQVDPAFVPGGGNLTDESAKANWQLPHEVDLSAMLQFERWNFPILSSTVRHDIGFSLQLTYFPKILRSE